MSTLEAILTDATSTLGAVTSMPELEQVKARYLGKSGSLTEHLKKLASLSADEKKAAGASINRAKAQVEALIDSARTRIARAELENKLNAEAIDVTLPGKSTGLGGLHPVTLCLERVETLLATRSEERRVGKEC